MICRSLIRWCGGNCDFWGFQGIREIRGGIPGEAVEEGCHGCDQYLSSQGPSDVTFEA
jgi:hypothetical protein